VKANCQDEMTALARIDTLPRSLLDYDPEVIMPASADLAAESINWLGFNQLIADPDHRSILEKLPKLKENEGAPSYIKRIWPKLSPTDRGAALDLGLQKTATMEKIAQVGIQLRIWRAYQTGEWLHSPSGETEFRPWLRSILIDSLEQSGAEATKLANVCEAVAWLRDNSFPDVELPKDLETCFMRRWYGRWKIIAAKVLQYRDAMDTMPTAEQELQEELAAIVATVYDEDLKQPDLNVIGRLKEPRMPPIVVVETERDANINVRKATLELSDLQYAHFLKKLGSSVEYRLAGEQYNTKDYILVEYRHDIEHDDWAYRAWSENDGWSQFLSIEPDAKRQGIFDSVHTDSDLQLEYLRYWE